MALPIEDYGVLGDSRTVALVGRDGSIDWLCLPRFDSPACFAALLGTPDHGRWLLGPSDVRHAVTTRRYVGNSFVLETTHKTPTGTVRVTDVMPFNDGRHDVVRVVEGVEGTVSMQHEWVVRFGYGKIRPWVTRRHGDDGHELISAIAGPDMLVLRGTRLPSAADGRHVDEFDVAAGESLTFATTWFKSHRPCPPHLNLNDHLPDTVQEWERWASTCAYEGPYEQAVVRSLLMLRLLTHGSTGGIVAAATTSLPESFGGNRNWDYRYCWLRDASLTLSSLLLAGYVEEAELWRDWLLRAIAGDPQDVQIMYAVDGARDLPERELAHLPGYADSRPVRIGNGAVGQVQIDVLGEVMAALGQARDIDGGDPAAWSLQRALIGELSKTWQNRDHGLWEIRGPERHFTHSRLMVWVAFNEMIRAVEGTSMTGPVDDWRAIRDQVREDILTAGYDAEHNTFVQHAETTDVDAALLLISLVGFLPGDDPRVVGTIAAIERDLLRDGLVMRYRTETGVDGLEGDEHPFLACSFWLAAAYAKAGRLDDAHALMRRLVELSNDLGLLAEEYDPIRQRMVGNFPQAFSHLALVQAAFVLHEADERAGRGERRQDSG